VSAIAPKLPKGLDSVIERAMAANPLDRFVNADEMLEAFLEAALPSKPATQVVISHFIKDFERGQDPNATVSLKQKQERSRTVDLGRKPAGDA